jgi:lysophospholipase L1-like esterase
MLNRKKFWGWFVATLPLAMWVISGLSGPKAMAQFTERASEKKLMMAALGDSITAATFADRPIHIRPGSQSESRAIIENKDSLSWASGKKIESHYLRLRRWLRDHGDVRKLEVFNVATPNRTTYDLERQASVVARKMRHEDYDALKYVTIFIGSNDACGKGEARATPLAVMKKNILNAVAILAEIPQREPIRILLVGLPRIPDLAQPSILNTKTTFGLTCHKIRDQMLGLCDPLLSWRTPEEYRAQLQVVADVNRLLEESASEVRAKFPNVEMVYTGRLFEQEILMAEDLAIDCFHPNAEAHRKIAKDTWLDQPWFE